MIAIKDVPHIANTLKRPNPPDSNDFGSLMPKRAKSINRVNSTATCAIILFCFLIPPLQANRTAPKAVGIRAVTEDTSI